MSTVVNVNVHWSLVYILLLLNKANSVSLETEPCKIRFYERQYFMGNSWSLDSKGTWTSSRGSLFRTPYRSFEMKSIRVFGLRSCRWRICPLRTRRNFSLPWWKKCKIANGGNVLSSLRAWGWPYYIIGNVYRLPDKVKKLNEVESIESGTSNRGFTTGQESSENIEGNFTQVKAINYKQLNEKRSLCTSMLQFFSNNFEVIRVKHIDEYSEIGTTL